MESNTVLVVPRLRSAPRVCTSVLSSYVCTMLQELLTQRESRPYQGKMLTASPQTSGTSGRHSSQERSNWRQDKLHWKGNQRPWPAAGPTSLPGPNGSPPQVGLSPA